MANGKWVAVVLVFLAFGAIMGILLINNDLDSFVLPTLVPTLSPFVDYPDVPTEVPADTPEPAPPRELVICQALEPNTLFVYGSPSRAARNVLEAVYDGPIDTRAYQFQPVILAKLPALDDGDVVVRTVEVGEGDRVVDVNEGVVDLLPGATVLDSADQMVTFEGGVVTMTQMVVTFTLRTDVTWADGQPLVADDFLYSFELAGEFDNPNLRFLRERTASYDAVDEYTLVWASLPGYRDTFYSYLYFLNTYPPLPRHVWGVTRADRLLNAEVAHRKPLGWGPFVVEEWVEGDRITLVRNSHYFRAAEELPYLDRVIFRFVPDLGRALDMLGAGECDLITQDVIEGEDTAPLLEAAAAGVVHLISSPSSEWEHLDFGIEPASWVSRPDFFGDERVRQAIALCVDRERIASETFSIGDAAISHSYVAVEHPLYAGSQLYLWAYDPSAGRSLLEEAGWLDEDEDGTREARGVAGIYNGTPFTVTLLTTGDDPARARAAAILTENLADCGVELAVQYFPDQEFFADGPDGLVFGRQFELALFSWLNGLDEPCWLYLSSKIPAPENWWAASNNPGYASVEYDEACQAALNALPGTDYYARFHREAQRIFSRDLPVLPLYFVPKVVAARPGVSGVVLDPGEYLELWNIEAFDVTRGAEQ
ncbi:MAG: peptide ABC transporter substrate-binding protein [Chloroflexi bacterium]|nr:peptide ABC transporter substrate-binding protein [Chloroflexota bacterium]